LKVRKSILQCSGTIVKIRNIGENTLEVRGRVKNRHTRRYTAYMPEKELGDLMRRAQEEQVTVSAMSRLIIGAYIESGLSLSEYKETMSMHRKKGKAKKK